MDQVFRKKIRRIFPKLVIIIAVVFLSNCVQLDTEKHLITHTLSVSKQIELLQTLHSVYPYQNDFQPTIAGSSGLVCILGDIAYPPQQKNRIS